MTEIETTYSEQVASGLQLCKPTRADLIRLSEKLAREADMWKALAIKTRDLLKETVATYEKRVDQFAAMMGVASDDDEPEMGTVH